MSDESLFDAVYHGDAAAVRRALRNGANVDCFRENDDTTPLMEACYFGYDEFVRILLDAGADARWRNSLDCSPIQYACQEGRLSTVEILINHDKDLLEFATDNGWTPLFVAIEGHHFDIVRFLMDRGANVHATTEEGHTTLMRACCKGAIAMVRLLLAASVDVEARDEDQKTAWHYAARSGRIDIVRELILQHNANMFAVDRKGRTPFDLISHRRDNPTVRIFLEEYANKMTRDHGPLALHSILGTAKYEYVEKEGFHPPLNPSLQILLPLGKLALNHFRSLLRYLQPEVFRNRNDSGKLPIHIACHQYKAPVPILALIVEHDVATLHMADYAGALPLHECCCCGVADELSVRFLVEQGGAGTLAARTREGAMPLHVLCGSTNPSLPSVQYLMQSFSEAATARTNAGQYPFVIAACKSSSASLSVVYVLVRAYPDLVIVN